MSDFFPIINVEPEPAFDPERIESMGSKRKFWCRIEDESGGADWLFKYPRENTGEHWAEKIAAEIAQLLNVSHAQVELAVCQNIRGSISKSFLSDNEWLSHGNESLANLASIHQSLDLRGGAYESRKKYRHSEPTLATILGAIEAYRGNESQFVHYVVLDGLIGNTDRHHENWGWIMDNTYPYMPVLAPSFDHASSLGRELTDERRETILRKGQQGAYSERATGGIYWLEGDKKGPAPLQLVRMALAQYHDFFRPVLEELSTLREGNILKTVNRVPEDWMTHFQRTFAVELVKYNLGQLRELIDG